MKSSIILAFTTGLALGQTFQSAPPDDMFKSCRVVSPGSFGLEFDAVTVKASGPLVPGSTMGISGGPGTASPGRVSMRRITLSHLLSLAYGMSATQIVAESWMNDFMAHGFDVNAIMPTDATKEQYCGMLRNLLVQRFHLTFHYVTKTRKGYKLVTLPNGPRFRRYNASKDTSDEADNLDNAPGDGKLHIRRNQAGFILLPPNQKSDTRTFMTPSGSLKLTFRGDMPSFARTISSHIGSAIVNDATGLEGTWDIYLEFFNSSHQLITPAPGLPDTTAASNPEPDSAPSLFSAVEQQLGLKLQKMPDVPVDEFVIDHADKVPVNN